MEAVRRCCIEKVLEKKTHCAICQEDIEPSAEASGLPVQLPTCEHIFHVDCIFTWFENGRAKCPLCKKDVKQEVVLCV